MPDGRQTLRVTLAEPALTSSPISESLRLPHLIHVAAVTWGVLTRKPNIRPAAPDTHSLRDSHARQHGPPMCHSSSTLPRDATGSRPVVEKWPRHRRRPDPEAEGASEPEEVTAATFTRKPGTGGDGSLGCQGLVLNKPERCHS